MSFLFASTKSFKGNNNMTCFQLFDEIKSQLIVSYILGLFEKPKKNNLTYKRKI